MRNWLFVSKDLGFTNKKVLRLRFWDNAINKTCRAYSTLYSYFQFDFMFYIEKLKKISIEDLLLVHKLFLNFCTDSSVLDESLFGPEGPGLGIEIQNCRINCKIKSSIGLCKCLCKKQKISSNWMVEIEA